MSTNDEIYGVSPIEVATRLVEGKAMNVKERNELLNRPPNPTLDIIIRPHVPTPFELLVSFVKKLRAKR